MVISIVENAIFGGFLYFFQWFQPLKITKFLVVVLEIMTYYINYYLHHDVVD